MRKFNDIITERERCLKTVMIDRKDTVKVVEHDPEASFQAFDSDKNLVKVHLLLSLSFSLPPSIPLSLSTIAYQH